MSSDINQLAIEVLKLYDISPKNITLIQGGSIKTVWKIILEDKIVCLKRLNQTIDKALFTVNAQIYIKNSGGNVPGVLINAEGKPITEYNNQIFVLYDWLDGRDLNFSNKQDLAEAMKGLAKFHISSKGYIPPEGCKISSKQGGQSEQYNSIKNKFIEWKETSKSNSGTQPYDSYLSYVDAMIDLSDTAIDLINKSSYSALMQDNNSLVLCHQDYGKGNAILTESGVFVLDLDGVTFDLPTRDLRKLIGKQAANNGIWDIAGLDDILIPYQDINPLSQEEKEVLYIDLLFPHGFFGLVKNLFKKNKIIKGSEIARTAKLELAKVALLNELLNINK